MKTKIIPLLIILSLLLLAACSAATESAPEMAEAPVEVFVEKAVEEAAVAPAAEAPAPADSAAAGGRADEGINQLALVPPGQSGRMVIKDAVMDLLVQDTRIATDQVTSLAASQGGYILSSNIWYKDNFPYANLRMAVPSANFEATLNLLRGFAIKVNSENASGQDVSAEYADLQSRLTNLEATRDRVRAFLDDATTVEESLKINQTLSDLEGQIEQVKGQMKFYEGRAAFSTIDVTLNPQYPTPTPTATPTQTPTPTPTPPWSPGSTITNASHTGVVVFQTIIDALIWLVLVLWPFLLLAGIIIWIVIAISRRNRRKRAAQAVPPQAPYYVPAPVQPQEPPSSAPPAPPSDTKD